MEDAELVSMYTKKIILAIYSVAKNECKEFTFIPLSSIITEVKEDYPELLSSSNNIFNPVLTKLTDEKSYLEKNADESYKITLEGYVYINSQGCNNLARKIEKAISKLGVGKRNFGYEKITKYLWGICGESVFLESWGGKKNLNEHNKT